MNQLTKRGGIYHLSQTIGGKRLRCSLGVRVPESARTLARQISAGLIEGPCSNHWRSLRLVLPPQSYKTLADRVGLSAPGIREFQKRWEEKLDRRARLGELAESSFHLYVKTAAVFFDWAESQSVREMDSISNETVERYLVGRKESMVAKGGTGRGVVTDHTVLQSVFNLAMEDGVIKKSPLGKYHAGPQSNGAEPFTPEEMDKLAGSVTDQNRTAFLLLRHTGMRCSDVVSVTWESINWGTKTLTWRTRKRKTVVNIPLVSELFDELSARCGESGPILEGLTREKLYRLVRELGKAAGVEKPHPHRFRDSLAVSILAKGGTIYDVARVLGISVSTADKFYTRFTEQLQDRIRGIMETR